MTIQQLRAHIESRLGSVEKTGIRWEDWQDFSLAALHRLANNAQQSGNENDFQADLSVALTPDSSVPPLFAVGSIPATALPDSIARVTEPTLSEPLEPKTSRFHMTYSFCQEYGQFSVESGNIYTYGPAGAILAGPATVRIIQIPTLATLNSKYDDELADECVKIYHERTRPIPVGGEDEPE